MTRFQQCLRHVLRHEGGYVDHPKDPGGATNFGITRKTLARWRKISPWWKLSKSEVRHLKTSEVAAIYQSHYWRRCGAHLMPYGLDHAVFDYAVNSGPSRAVKQLQAIVGVKSDGINGPKTRANIRRKIEQKGVRWLIVQVCQSRLRFLHRLSSFKTFGKGWTRRVQSVQRVSLAAAGNAPPSLNKPRLPPTQKRTQPMHILSGYKTYIVAIAMLLAGISQMIGVELPGFNDQAAGKLIFEALAVLFLRRGLKTEIGNA